MAVASKENKKGVVGKADVPDITREGRQIVLPEGMDYDEAIVALKRRRDFEEQEVAVVEMIHAFPWDAAWAVEHVVAERFGWHQGEKIPSFFGDIPPQRISVEIGPNDQTGYVMWGRFSIPGVEGWLQTGFHVPSDGRSIAEFQLSANVLRKHEWVVKAIAEDARSYLKAGGSIYQGKSIRIRFTKDDGEVDLMPFPKFIDVSEANEERLIFSDSVFDQVKTNLYAPIDYRQRLPEFGVPFRRGVLLAGTFGTGKTELAMTAAHKANQNGISFVYCEAAKDLPMALQFAQQYAPAVVFVEDIDRVVSGPRDASIDQILNTLDGLDSKTHQVMTVLTTNKLDVINEAMIRPGRIDVVIEVTPPDAAAAERLIRLYGRGLIPETEDLSTVADLLSNNIPAVIREILERSKLAAVSRTQGADGTIHASDIQVAAASMKNQIRLLSKETERTLSDQERSAIILAEAFTGISVDRDLVDFDDRLVAAAAATNRLLS